MARWGNSKKSSGRHIAALLECHGFTPAVAGAIRRWYRGYSNAAALAKIDGRKEIWRLYSRELTTPQLKALGDFVNQMMEAAFVSGVRIGLATRLFDVPLAELLVDELPDALVVSEPRPTASFGSDLEVCQHCGGDGETEVLGELVSCPDCGGRGIGKE